MKNVIYGLHTGEAKHWITLREANSAKAFFGVELADRLISQKQFYQDGITELWLEEIPCKNKRRYYMHIRTNFARCIGLGDYTLMPYTAPNIRKAIANISKILKQIGLRNGNEKFNGWTVERLDDGFDVYDDSPELLVYLMNHSLYLFSSRRRKAGIKPIHGKAKEELLFESIRFGNTSCTFNIYAKYRELLSKHPNATEEMREEIEEMKNVLRLERQSREAYAIKKLLPNRTIGDLAEKVVRENILKTILDDVDMYFGRGDYYSYEVLQKKQWSEDEWDAALTVGSTIGDFTRQPLMDNADRYTPEVRVAYERLGIAPTGIPSGLSHKYGTGEVTGIYNRLVAEYPRPKDKRSYGVFPAPHLTADGRKKSTFSLYKISGKEMKQVAAKTTEEYEEKVFKVLRNTVIRNITDREIGDEEHDKIFCKSIDYMKRFAMVAETKTIKEKAERFASGFSQCKLIKEKGENKNA